MYEVMTYMDGCEIRKALWIGGKENAEKLTEREFEEFLEVLFDEYYTDEKPSLTQINDILWFEFEWVCEIIGLKYDCEAEEVLR